MKRFILTTILGLALTTTAWAQEAGGGTTDEPQLTVQTVPDEDAARRLELAERYFELSEGEGFAELMDTMTGQLMSILPDMPAEQQAWLRRNLPLEMTAFGEMLMEQMVPLFADAMTLEELEALIEFYDTPVGRSIAAKQMELGAQMGVVVEFAQMEFQIQFMQKYCAAFDCTGVRPDVLQPT